MSEKNEATNNHLSTNKNGILWRYPWLLNPFHFLLNFHKLPVLFTEIRRQGKLTELMSFAIWEVMYRIGLYKKKCLCFTSAKPYVVTDNFHEDLASFFGRKYKVVEPGINWKLFVKHGSLQVGVTHESVNTLVRMDDYTNKRTTLYGFGAEVCALFVCSSGVLIICLTNGEVFRTNPSFFLTLEKLDQPTFIKCLELSNAESSVRRKYAITETPGKIVLLGEYGNILNAKERWVNCAYFYMSTDQGQTWNRSDFLIQNGTNKHIHILFYSRLLNAIVMSDGDNKKKLWIGEADPRDTTIIRWRLINKYHFQTGGYISVAETQDLLLFGSDYLGGTNFIVKTSDGKHFHKQVIPSPYRRCPVQEIQIRSTASPENQKEIWGLLYNPFAQFSKSILMVSDDDGKSWDRIIEYDASKYELSISSNYRDCPTDIYITVKKTGATISSQNIRSYIFRDTGTLQVIFLQVMSCMAVV